jgi:hypothetical protein
MLSKLAQNSTQVSPLPVDSSDRAGRAIGPGESVTAAMESEH